MAAPEQRGAPGVRVGRGRRRRLAELVPPAAGARVGSGLRLTDEDVAPFCQRVTEEGRLCFEDSLRPYFASPCGNYCIDTVRRPFFNAVHQYGGNRKNPDAVPTLDTISLLPRGILFRAESDPPAELDEALQSTDGSQGFEIGWLLASPKVRSEEDALAQDWSLRSQALDYTPGILDYDKLDAISSAVNQMLEETQKRVGWTNYWRLRQGAPIPPDLLQWFRDQKRLAMDKLYAQWQLPPVGKLYQFQSWDAIPPRTDLARGLWNQFHDLLVDEHVIGANPTVWAIVQEDLLKELGAWELLQHYTQATGHKQFNQATKDAASALAWFRPTLSFMDEWGQPVEAPTPDTDPSLPLPVMAKQSGSFPAWYRALAEQYDRQ